MTAPSVRLGPLLDEGPLALFRRMADGHPVDLDVLADREYHGIALGNPRFVERLSWKTFKKVFLREADGSIRGWNAAVEQQGVDGAYDDRLRGGERVTYWHYALRPGHAYPASPFPFGAMIDYGLGEAGALNPQRLVRDPLVSLEAGSSDLLLGYSYAAVGSFPLHLPTFFALVRGGPLTYVVPSPRAA
ncbi:MAG: hypothetical protein H6732_14540 [Alphaproteobacteria bacterium]|nr:hypothetical protein [Alphaproteobacteria bacterium]